MRHEILIESISPINCRELYHLEVFGWLADPQKLDQVGEEVLGCVTACGYTADRLLNDHGWIQLCLLLTSDLFQFDEAFTRRVDKLLDARNGLQRSCQDRPKLITTVTDVLLQYGRNWAYQERGQPLVEWLRTREACAYLERIFRSVLHVRGKEGFATHPYLKNTHRSTLEKDWARMVKLFTALTLEDFKLFCQPELNVRDTGELSIAYNCQPEPNVRDLELDVRDLELDVRDLELDVRDLELDVRDLGEFSIEYTPMPQTEFAPATFRGDWLPDMYNAFKQYGPLSGSYPEIAIFHALAAISLQFGLQDGDRETVAKRLQKRLQRREADAAQREAEQAAESTE